MRPSHLTHTLEKDRDSVHLSVPSESLALVDVESYPAFIGKKADYFDLMAHLSAQMQALTILPWKAPDHALKLELLLAENDLTQGVPVVLYTQLDRPLVSRDLTELPESVQYFRKEAGHNALVDAINHALAGRGRREANWINRGD